MNNGQNKNDIKIGLTVSVVLKRNKKFGNLTKGIVADILTKSDFQAGGIKVRLKDGQIGRVQEILEP